MEASLLSVTELVKYMTGFRRDNGYMAGGKISNWVLIAVVLG